MFYGEKMRQLRKQKRLSMAEIAKETGISEAYVSMLETGKRECPDGKVLYLISKKLNCEAGDLTDNAEMLEIMHSMFGNPVDGREGKESSKRKVDPLYGDIAKGHGAAEISEPVKACPACAAKDKEIDWLRSTITNLQENFKEALAAVKTKGITSHDDYG